MSQYQKDGLRPLTKVFRKESGDWIVWNWDTAQWDEFTKWPEANAVPISDPDRLNDE